MEQARISTPPSPHGTAAAKGKAAPAKNEGATDTAPAAGFLALLGLLGDGTADETSALPALADDASMASPGSKRKTAATAGAGGADQATAGMDAMPWLLAGSAVLSPPSLPPTSEAGNGLAVEGQSSLASQPKPDPALGQGLAGQATAQSTVFPDSLSSPLGQGGALGAPVLATAPEVPLDGLVSQTRQLDAGVEVEVRSQYVMGGAGAYQSTVDKAKDLLSGAALRGNGATALGKAALDNSQGGASTLSTAMAAKVAERTVDPAQWVLREGARAETIRMETVGAAGAGLLGAEALPEGRIAGAAGASAGSRGGSEGQPPGGFASAGGGDPLASQGAVEVGGAAAEGFGLSPEERVADQVSQWVGKTIHNAELTVGRESQAVQVTVTLSGQEAQVRFRTDEGQTRALLDAHLSELQEMLRNQGLELSGAWVGTSSQQQSGRDPVPSQGTMALRSSPRLETATVPAATPTAVRASRQSAGGGGLDVFV